jgi:drug/metabolite transporter (DMT)-like permease
MKFKYSVGTNLLFLCFAILWGASYPITQNAIASMSPYLFVFFRFGIATVIISPYIFKKEINLILYLKIGIILGLLNTAIYTCETLSLKYTTVSKSSFIMGANVVLVPFVAHLFRISKITITEIIAAIFFLVGMYILTDTHFINMNYGDLLALLGAFAIAISISYLQHISHANFNSTLLTFFQFMFTCPIPFLLYLSQPNTVNAFTLNTLLTLLFCGIFATAIPLLGQIKYQKYTTAAQTASIFALEPIFAILFAYAFYKEKLTINIVLGGAIMLLSTIIPTIFSFLNEKPQKTIN